MEPDAQPLATRAIKVEILIIVVPRLLPGQETLLRDTNLRANELGLAFCPGTACNIRQSLIRLLVERLGVIMT